MTKIIQLFIIIIIIIIIQFSLLISTIQSQPIQFYYNDFANAGNSISLQDSAKLIKHNHNTIIQLTNTTSRVMGHVFYNTPIKLNPSGSTISFSSTFTIGTVPEFRQLGGHGMAFVITPSPTLSQAFPAQYLGLFNSNDIGNSTNQVFALEFDTVKDFEFDDINDNHVGINFNTLVSNFSVPATYSLDNMTKVNVTFKEGKTIQVWLDYDGPNKLINVTISPNQAKPKFPLISYRYDLSEILSEDVYIGFAGASGLLASSHYVAGWSFNTSGPATSLPMTPLPPNPIPKSAKNHTKLATALSVSLSLGFILVVLGVIYMIKRIKEADVIEDWELSIGPHRYPYHELKRATKGFRDKELLGRGGFGRVYKGTLPKSNTQVAVKRINHESRQGLKEFVAEIASIGKLRHRNLVRLLGWCRRRGDLLLVYDYMPFGSLDKYLFDHRGNSKLVLNWDQRFRIINGVASGLLYLHEGWEKVVIHRDIKASNVLLDGEFNGRLGDFGLARLQDHGAALGTTRVVGTLGYLAPELSRTGHVTTNSDVFAFGALLLEVVCGRKPIEHRAEAEEVVLVDWVWAKWEQGKVLEVVDHKLMGLFNEEQVLKVIKVGLMCSSDDPKARPNMRLVMRYLEGEVEVPQDLKPPNLDDQVKGVREPRVEDYVYSFATTSSGVSLQSHGGGDELKRSDGYTTLNTTTFVDEEEDTSVLMSR